MFVQKRLQSLNMPLDLFRDLNYRTVVRGKSS